MVALLPSSLFESKEGTRRDLVEPVARFDPKLVKMAPDGEKAED